LFLKELTDGKVTVSSRKLFQIFIILLQKFQFQFQRYVRLTWPSQKEYISWDCNGSDCL